MHPNRRHQRDSRASLKQARLRRGERNVVRRRSALGQDKSVGGGERVDRELTARCMLLPNCGATVRRASWLKCLNMTGDLTAAIYLPLTLFTCYQ